MLRNALIRWYSQSAASKAKVKSIGVIGVPFHKGQSKSGVELAPKVMRESGLLSILKNFSGCEINDYGDVEYSTEKLVGLQNMKNFSEVMSCNESLAMKVKTVLEQNDQFLTIGGDHSIGFGSIAGHLLYDPNISVVWVDAHADINLNVTSNSGNVHGMPLAMIVQELRKYWENSKVEKIAPQCLPAKQIVYIGLRDVDPYEAYILQELGIKAFNISDIDKLGMNKVLEQTLDTIKPTNKIHISFDIDALDTTIAPSTGTRVEGGLTLREGLQIMETLRSTNRIQGVDLVEVNPKLGSENDVKLTVSSGIELLKVAFGHNRFGDFRNIDKGVLQTKIVN